jgi:hypothetical protein
VEGLHRTHRRRAVDTVDGTRIELEIGQPLQVDDHVQAGRARADSFRRRARRRASIGCTIPDGLGGGVASSGSVAVVVVVVTEVVVGMVTLDDGTTGAALPTEPLPRVSTTPVAAPPTATTARMPNTIATRRTAAEPAATTQIPDGCCSRGGTGPQRGARTHRCRLKLRVTRNQRFRGPQEHRELVAAWRRAPDPPRR